ncbi:MAG: HlyD family efflux transporter periplasmic adaptor subunit [Planctomycetales bacterium]
MRKSILAAAILAAVLLAVLLYSQRESRPFHVSGFIEADEIRIGSRIGGRVQSVHVAEGQTVEAGAVLVALEPFTLQSRKQEAAARLAQALADYGRLTAGFRPEEIGQAEARVERLEAQLAKLLNGPRPEEIEIARNELQEAEALLEKARDRERRVADLAAKNAVTPETQVEARTDAQAAQATAAARKQRLDLLLKGTRQEELDEARAQLREAREAAALVKSGYRSEEIAGAQGAVQAAQASVQTIERELAELEIHAPYRSVVQAVDLQPGDLVRADQPVLSLVDVSNLWVRAYLPEDRLNVALGQPLWVTVDSYPERAFRARLTFVSQQGEFTPRNVQTPEERSRQVFRIKVTLEEGLDLLRPGMAADVWLEEP